MSTLSTREARLRRHRRIRGKVSGTSERPRLAVFRSNRGIFAQLIDDQNARTLAASSWLQLKGFSGDKTEQATEVGKKLSLGNTRPWASRTSSAIFRVWNPVGDSPSKRRRRLRRPICSGGTP